MKIMLFVLFAYSLTTSVYGATVGSVVLSGAVPKVVSVTVTGQGVYNNLDLTTTQVNLLVANVQEQSNDSLGYKVSVASLNAGQLKNGTSGLVYTAKYNGTGFTLTTPGVQVTTQGAQTAVVSVVRPLTISYTGVPYVSMLSGVYTDTLTVTIIAN